MIHERLTSKPGLCCDRYPSTPRRVLWRGEKPEKIADVEQGAGIAAEVHAGTLAQHAADIADGTRRATGGLSLTKDPYIAARYAAQSGGEVVGVRADGLREAGSRVASPALEADVPKLRARTTMLASRARVARCAHYNSRPTHISTLVLWVWSSG